MPLNVLWKPTRLKCFYCGGRSKQNHIGKVQSFECDACEATNYLDENGSITDPPFAVTRAEATPPRPYSAQSPPAASQDSNPNLTFCDVCLRNQRLHYENLRLYLPERHDPRYLEFAAALPKYKERLEQQYPLICGDCAPEAREKIKQSGYLAKTDHIRRLMDATRSGNIPPRRQSTWRWLIIVTGALLWWFSLLAQVSWHVLGVSSEPYDSALPPADEDVDLTSCVLLLPSQQVSIRCVTHFTSYLPWITVASVLSLWWNPALYKRYFGRTRGRLTRLTEYYCHCIVANVVRQAIMYMLANPFTTPIQGDLYRAGHGFGIIFTIGTTIAALLMVKLDTNPRVNFNLHPSQILPNVPDRPQNVPRPLRTGGVDIDEAPSPSLAAQQAMPLQPTNLNRQTPVKARFQAPAPLEPENDPDAMDWSPAPPAPSYHLRPRSNQPEPERQPLIAGPNPFAQKVPSAPAARMRHPMDRSIPDAPFTNAPEQPQQNFFSLRQQQQQTRPSRQSSEDTEYAPSNGSTNPFKPKYGSGSQKIDFNPAPPRLSIRQDKEETGLEGLFDTVFSFKEEPAEVSQAKREPSPQRQHAQSVAQQKGAGLRMFEVHRDEPTAKWKGALLSVIMFGVIPACILGGVYLGVRLSRASELEKEL